MPQIGMKHVHEKVLMTEKMSAAGVTAWSRFLSSMAEVVVGGRFFRYVLRLDTAARSQM